MCARTVQVAALPGEVVSNTGKQNRKVLAAPVMGASASVAGATTLLRQNQRIMDAVQTLENASLHITEWDESAVRQLVETVKVLSKDEIAVTLKGGIEICQKIMY